mmetsp:Transcript_14962/g.34249  ORF Transcript_14962/g.34249 Transcript_14962/m.34249 type:complete len:274 (-) Transcript_14962:763-1584(-)
MVPRPARLLEPCRRLPSAAALGADPRAEAPARVRRERPSASVQHARVRAQRRRSQGDHAGAAVPENLDDTPPQGQVPEVLAAGPVEGALGRTHPQVAAPRPDMGAADRNRPRRDRKVLRKPRAVRRVGDAERHRHRPVGCVCQQRRPRGHRDEQPDLCQPPPRRHRVPGARLPDVLCRYLRCRGRHQRRPAARRAHACGAPVPDAYGQGRPHNERLRASSQPQCFKHHCLCVRVHAACQPSSWSHTDEDRNWMKIVDSRIAPWRVAVWPARKL